MKKQTLFTMTFFAFGILTAMSQPFEGVIKWKLSYEISDPKMRSQAAQANSPENAQKMSEAQKQMMAKMNDPEFKKMMEQNPQMKEQMEKAMAQMAKNNGSGGSPISAMPVGMTLKFKNGNSLSKVIGGAMEGKEILNLADKDETYSIDRAGKTYSKIKRGSSTSSETTQKPVITKTEEFITVAGYKCRKYVVEHPSDKSTQVIWASSDLKGLDLKAFKKMRGNDDKAFIYDSIDGVPLKVEGTTKELKYTMEVMEINKQSIDASEVSIPAGYTER